MVDVPVRQVWAHLSDPVFVLDIEGLVTAANPAAAACIGVAVASLPGRPFRDWIHPDWRGRWDQAVSDLRDDVDEVVPVRLRLAGMAARMEVTAHVVCVGEALVTVLRPDHADAPAGANGHDLLTGLPTRPWLEAALADALAGPDGRRIALVQVDLDDFRDVNDAYGYEAGNAVLKAVAERLALCSADGTVVRTGGDEFALFLPGGGEMAGVERVVQRALSLVAMPVSLGDQEVRIRVSVGLAGGMAGQDSPQDLVRGVGLATAAAKKDRHRSGSRYVVYDRALGEAAEERAEFMADFAGALEGDELFVVFQPIIDTATTSAAAAEALVRWRHARRGVLTASEFVKRAEELGFVGRLDRWVLDRACAQAAAWTGSLARLPITVNMSALSASSPTLCYEVETALATHGLDPSRLILEVTETAMVEDADRVREQLLALKALGVRVALDDFGTGYSSLAYLEQLPFDFLKIDGSYSRRVAEDQRAQAIVGATLQLAEVLGLTVIVEGIESSEHVRLLTALGVDLFQGYHFAVPVEEHQLAAAVTEACLRVAEVQSSDPRNAPDSREEKLLGLLADQLQSRMDNAGDQVRRGLAAELHDEPLQALWAADLSLESQRSADEEDAAARLEQLLMAQNAVRQAMTGLRRMMTSVRPSDSSQGLAEQLADLVSGFSAQHPDTVFSLRTKGLETLDHSEVGLHSQRIVQEALLNVVKHAQAATASVDVHVTGGTVEIEVADDGVGFDPSQLAGHSDRSGYGTIGMQDRAGLLGGLVGIESKPGEGTTVRALLPVRQFVSSALRVPG